MNILYIGKNGSDIKNMAITTAAELLNIDPAQISSHPDYLYIGLDDKAKSIGVDKAALVVDKAALKPAVASCTVCIIDNMNKMTVEAQNKILKTLEDSSIIIIGACYEDNLLATVKSRCQIIRVQDNALPDDVKGIFSDIKEAMDNHMYSNIFQILHLVKEKDSQSFFNTYRPYVGELINVFGNCSKITKNENVASKLADHRLRAMGLGYSKDDFFLLIATIVSFMEE